MRERQQGRANSKYRSTKSISVCYSYCAKTLLSPLPVQLVNMCKDITIQPVLTYPWGRWKDMVGCKQLTLFSQNNRGLKINRMLEESHITFWPNNRPDRSRGVISEAAFCLMSQSEYDLKMKPISPTSESRLLGGRAKRTQERSARQTAHCLSSNIDVSQW